MVFDDPAVVVMGKEPILRRRRRASATSPAPNYGYSIGRGIVYGYLPVELAVEGDAGRVEYFDERLPRPRGAPSRCGTRRARTVEGVGSDGRRAG